MASTPDFPLPSEPDDDDVGPHQLDFYQAMTDFKHMFPNMEEEIIEAVLRSNNGAVDATIDQLLTMNVEGVVRVVPQPPMPTGDSSSGEEDLPSHYPPPPSYDAYNKTKKQTTDAATDPPPMPPPALSGSLIDAPIADLMAMGTNDSLMKDDMHGAIGGHKTGAGSPRLPLQSGSHYPHDITPHQPLPSLLDSGTVPPTPRPPPRDNASTENSSRFMGSHKPAPPLPPKFPRTPETFSPRGRPCPMPKRILYKWNPPLLGNLPENFLKIGTSPSSTLTTPQRLAGLNGTASPQNTRSRSSITSPGVTPRRSASASPVPSELSSAMLQQKMVENERRRSSMAAGDPGTQMLQDEHLALMLQNEEFLVELMQDAEFMRVFQRDRMNATAFEPSSGRDPTDHDKTTPDGYGDDRDKALGAFPFDRSVDYDGSAEFRKQLKHMGGSSKKKFAAAAKNFFTRKKKKSPKPALRGSAPSTMNLLAEEEKLDDSVPCPRSDPRGHEPIHLTLPLQRSQNTVTQQQMQLFSSPPPLTPDDQHTTPKYLT